MVIMSDEVITLNVGGAIYTTTLSTLTRYPESMLGAMFNGQYIPTKMDKQGHYFIDRDGSMFKYILQYLRSGELCLPTDFNDLELLRAEVDYFQIPGLVDKVQDLVLKKQQCGHYVEIMEFEESCNFCRFYENIPVGLNSPLMKTGLVISGPRALMLTLPLPEPAASTVQSDPNTYSVVNVTCMPAAVKMTLIHSLRGIGGKLLSSNLTNSTDSDGSYTIHKYMWYVPP